MKLVLGMVLAAAIALAGCASRVVVPETHAGSKPAVRALESYSVKLAAQAKAQLPENVKFDIDALNRALGKEFTARNLVAPDGDYRLEVVVTDIRVRSTFSAVMWGFMAGDDHIYGTGLVYKTGADTPGYEFAVKTSYALGGLAGGQDGVRLEWMYEEFAKQISEHLAEKRDAKGKS